MVAVVRRFGVATEWGRVGEGLPAGVDELAALYLGEGGHSADVEAVFLDLDALEAGDGAQADDLVGVVGEYIALQLADEVGAAGADDRAVLPEEAGGLFEALGGNIIVVSHYALSSFSLSAARTLPGV